MTKKEDLFVTIIVKDLRGGKVAAVKNAKYEKGMACIDKIIDTKYRQQRTPPPPALVMSILLEGATSKD